MVLLAKVHIRMQGWWGRYELRYDVHLLEGLSDQQDACFLGYATQATEDRLSGLFLHFGVCRPDDPVYETRCMFLYLGDKRLSLDKILSIVVKECYEQ